MTTVKASGCITAIHLVYRYSLKTRYTVPISIFYYTHNWFIQDSKIRVISWHHPVSSQLTSRLSAIKKQSDISTEEEILAETKRGSDSGLWKQRALKLLAQTFMWLLFYLFWMPFLQPITGALSNISKFTPKWIFVVSSLLIFMVTLALGSKRKEPRNVSFDDLVGVNTAKVELKEISSILQGKSEYKRLRAKLPDGVLLYGPPGTGKTTLVHALAREAKVSFFPVSARDIAKVSTGVGGIKSLFFEARICSPSIIFIEDAVVEQKGNCEHGSPFMELYNEMEKCNNDGSVVVVIAATDTPETLDPALISFGRFSKKVHVGKPDKDVKRKIVDLHLKKVIREEDKEAICNLIASQTEGLVWDDLKNIADESTRLAARRGDNHVTVGIVHQALRRVTHNCHNGKDQAMIQEHMQHNAESVAFESQN